MTTANDIITGALKLLGVLYKSETPSADESADALESLNDLLESWSNDDLMTYSLSTESFPLTGAAQYTIGTGGDFNTQRPININNALVRIANIDYPLDIIPPEMFQQIPFKSITTMIPSFLTYDNGYPLGVIKMYTIPTAGGTLIMQLNKPLLALTSLTDSIALPTGWNKALKFNLAVDLAPTYGVQISEDVRKQAALSQAAIRRSTSVTKPMPLESNRNVNNNIFTGWYL
jgi:hypothetical protein